MRGVAFIALISVISSAVVAIIAPITVVSALESLNTRLVAFIIIELFICLLISVYLITRTRVLFRLIISSIGTLFTFLFTVQINASIGLPFKLYVTNTQILFESGEVTPLDPALTYGILAAVVALFIMAMIVDWADRHQVDVLRLILQKPQP